MNREQFRTAYRNARKACRFAFQFYLHGLNEIVKPESMWATENQCPGFEATRLFGDHLRFGVKKGLKSRLYFLRLPVSLPA